MATPFRLKRSAVPGKRPSLSDVQLGELAFNTYDGYLLAERDTGGVGIGTTIALLTPWTENFGAASIYYQKSVGIGTTNPRTLLQVGSATTNTTMFAVNQFGDVGIGTTNPEHYDTFGILTLDGYALPGSATTFGGGNIILKSNGQKFFDLYSLTGSTAGFSSETILALNRPFEITQGSQYSGGASSNYASVVFTNTYVGIGTTTLTSKFTVQGDVFISGFSTFRSDLAVAGVTTTRHLNVIGFTTVVNQSITGVATVGSNLTVAGVTTTRHLNVIGFTTIVNESVTGVSTIGTLAVSGVSTTRHLNVIGVSTLGGGVTITSGGNINAVSGVVTAAQFTTGVGAGITITTNTIFAPQLLIIDPSPAGVGTTSGVVQIKGDLYVDGTQFVVNSTTIELGDFNIGIATTVGTNALLDGAGLGIGSANIRKNLTYANSSDSLKSSENFDLASGKVYKINGTELLSATQLTVANINAVGVSTLGTLAVSGVTTTQHLNVTGFTTVVNQLITGVATVNNNFIVNGNTLVANATNNRVGIGTTNPSSTLDVHGNVAVSGVTTTQHLNVVGFTTVVNQSITGVVTAGTLAVTGVTTTQHLNVTGFTTVVNQSITGVVTVGSNLAVAGVTTTRHLNVTGFTTVVNQSITGVATIGTLAVSGVTTTRHLNVIGFTTVVNQSITGVATVGSNLTVAGVTTTQHLNVTGFTTVVNQSITGVLTVSNGIQGIGIQSGGSIITTGIITSINFVGAGNSFSYNAGTKTVDINIGGSQWTFVDSGSPSTSSIYRVNGNVGIGTTNPRSKLEVNGVVGFTTFDYFGEITAKILIGDSETGKSLPTNVGNGNILIGVGAGTSLSSHDYNTFIGHRAGSISRSNNNTFIGYYAGYFNTTGSSNVFVGGQAGQSNDTGNFNTYLGQGAGQQGYSAAGNVALGLAAGYDNLTGSNNIFLGLYNGESTGASNKIIIGSGDLFGNKFDSPDITKNTQLAIGVRTDSNQSKYWIVGNENFNIGIGTTNPTSKLHVIGNTLVSGVSTILSNSSTEAFRITQLGTGNAFVVEDSANPDTTPFVIDQSGNVGLGTITPAAILDVNGTRIFHKLSGINTVEFGYGAGSGDNTAYGLYVPSGRNFYLYGNNTFQLAATSTGVGIGTTNPQERVDILGNAKVSGVTSTQHLNVTGFTTTVNQRITGVATIGTLAVSGVTTTTHLNVIGFTTTSNQSITGVATIGTLAVSGVATTRHLNVIGFTTVVNQSVTGVITAGTLAVSGVTTTQHLNVTGIATLNRVAVTTEFNVYAPLATFYNNVNINGTLSIGGTTILLNAEQLQIKDKDIILGITTNSLGNDVSKDSTANHGGIAIASTEGTPLIDISVIGIDTIPSTYKQIMWIAKDTLGAGTTDAWHFNYGVGIGSTQIPNGVRLAVGRVQVTDNTVSAENLSLTGVATVASNLIVAGVTSTRHLSVTGFTTIVNESVTGVSTIGTLAVSGVATTRHLNVIGFTTTSNQSITGVATVGSNFAVAGVTTTQHLNVIGFTTVVNQSITGVATVGTLAVSGVTTTRHLSVSGISSLQSTTLIGGGTSTGTASQTLQITGGAYISGKLGIGTTNPFAGVSDQGIDVNFGTPSIFSRMIGTNAEAGVWAADQDYFSLPSYKGVGIRKYGTGTAGNIIPGIPTADTGALAFQNTTNAVIYTNGVTPLVFATFSTERLRIDGANGNIGIGTTNPQERVDILGNARVSGVTSTQHLNVIGFTTVVNQSITGVATIGTLAVSGVTTTQHLNVVGFTTVVNQSITGVATVGTLAVSGVTTTRHLSVVGFTTVVNQSITGVATVGSNFAVAGVTTTQHLNVTGIATIANLVVSGIITAVSVASTYVIQGSVVSSSSTTAQIGIHSALSSTTYRSVEYMIQAAQPTNFHTTKILVVHNGTTAYLTEYGTIYNSSVLADYDVDISGGNIRLLSTPASAGITTYTISFIATRV
jgi:hypothetical protein